MNKRQYALKYLNESAKNVMSACKHSMHNDDTEIANDDVAEKLGKMFSAMKEVAETLQLQEEQVERFAYAEYERRQKQVYKP
jgi:hypothetical protein